MKKNTRSLSEKYLAALRTHLNARRLKGYHGAQTLGRAAVAAGLATAELVQIHQQALVVLAKSPAFATPTVASIKRASAFFAQALIPLEANRRTIPEANRHLRQRNKVQRQHTAALARCNRQLAHEIARRKAGEATIEQAKEQYRTLFLESQAMQHKLRQLTRQIISAQEEERKRISRELHDEVVQTLVGINVELSALSQELESDVQLLKRKIARTQRLVATSVSAVHRFARELRPTVLDDLGLIPALHAFSTALAARKQIHIEMTAFSGVEALTNAKRTVLFRVAQEALNNVARHADASEVKIGITSVPGGIRMEIIDNGKSFPVRETLLANTDKRLGLVGMKERIEMSGGSLAIESSPGIGTTIRTEIPFKPRQNHS